MTELANLITATRVLADRAVEHARTVTRHGEAIDEHQVLVERIAYAATEARVIAELVDAPRERAPAALVAAADLAQRLRNRLESVLPFEPRYADDIRALIVRETGPDPVAAIGDLAIAQAGRLAWPLDETLDEVRANVRAFAEREILPHAERIHHHDELVPERF
ncbi:MAG: hypothetical protein ABI678_09935, partial [Kofleriaceae bacterium]